MKDKTLKQLVESIKVSGQPKTSAYDTSATVTRVEGQTAWVHIPGGVRETPVKLTINAKAGDTVQVRVSGGRAFMVGNASAPPTDDRVATQALTETRTVDKVVRTVQKLAEKTARIAGNTNQYFWHVQEGTDTGAHITEIPQEEFLADPTNGGGNLLARSNGIAIRDGLTELASFDSDGIEIGTSAVTKILLDQTNGLKLGNAVQITPNGNASFTGTITATSGQIGNFTIDTPIEQGGTGTLTYYDSDKDLYFVVGNDLALLGATPFLSIGRYGTPGDVTTLTYNFYVMSDGTIGSTSLHPIGSSTSIGSSGDYWTRAYITTVNATTLNCGNFKFGNARFIFSDICKSSGDTWTVDYAGGGYVTNNGKKFQWSVPTPHITGTVSVTALTGYIRQNGNYLVGSASATGTFPIGNITVEKMTGFVRFTYDASSAPTGVTNNDVISVQLRIAFRVA